MNQTENPTSRISANTRKHIDAILEICLDLLPEDAQPISAILSGGFARGESGHYFYNGRMLPFGDYDIDVVLPRPLLDSEREPIDTKLEEQLAFQAVTSDSAPTLVEDAEVHNVLDLRFKTLDEFLNRTPDLALFDFLNSYEVLHGEDPVRDRLSIDLDEISVFSPLRIVSNRLVLALKHISTDYCERDPTRHETLALRLAICRLYLDLAGSIGFLFGFYRTGYSERVQFLESDAGLWRSWFPDVEGFLARLENARSFKLKPVLEEVSGTALLAEWFNAIHDVGQVLPHATNLALLTRKIPLATIQETLHRAGAEGKQAGAVTTPFEQDWRSLVARQVKMFPSLYYRDFIHNYLRRMGRNLPFSMFLSAQASRYYGVMEHIMWRGRKWVFKNTRRSLLAPASFQTAVLPLLLFSLSPKLEVNLQALEMFDKLMNPYMLMPFEFLPPLKRWEATKRCFVHEMLDYRAKG